MDAHEKTIKQIIEGVNQYIIPLYQRAYEWHKKEWEDLWNDLLYQYKNESSNNHFLGSIVTTADANPGEVTKYQLIDGQQRLTTIFILLAALRDRIKINDLNRSDKIHKKWIINEHESEDDRLKLLPTLWDRNAFKSIIEPSDGDLDTTSSNSSKIISAYDFFEDCLKENPDINMEKLIDILISKFIIITIGLKESEDNAYRIFETLNHRGTDLYEADLIRNYLFMRVKKDEQEKIYEKYWHSIQNSVGENKLTAFFRDFLMKDGSIVNLKEVYATFLKLQINTSNVLEYLRKFRDYAIIYARLMNPGDKEENESLREKLERLNRIKATTTYPFLLNIYYEYKNQRFNLPDFIIILNMVENFLIRRFICKIPSGALNKIFLTLYPQTLKKQKASQISFTDALAQTLAMKGYPKDEDFEKKFANENLYANKDRGKTDLILWSLEESYHHKEQIEKTNTSIEHIMPRTLSSEWRKDLGRSYDTIHRQLLNTIGNLTLTGYNIELYNYNFDKKKKIYSESHFELNSYFKDKDIDKWDDSQILIRGKELAKRASLQVWQYFGTKEVKEPPEFKKDLDPIMLTFLSKQYPVSKWHDVLQKILEAIYEYDSDTYEYVIDQVTTLNEISKTKMEYYRELPGGYWMTTKLNSKRIYKRCCQIIEYAGLASTGWQIEYSV